MSVELIPFIMEGDINMLIPQKEYLLKDLKINQYLLTASNPNNIELPNRGLEVSFNMCVSP